MRYPVKACITCYKSAPARPCTRPLEVRHARIPGRSVMPSVRLRALPRRPPRSSSNINCSSGPDGLQALAGPENKNKKQQHNSINQSQQIRNSEDKTSTLGRHLVRYVPCCGIPRGLAGIQQKHTTARQTVFLGCIFWSAGIHGKISNGFREKSKNTCLTFSKVRTRGQNSHGRENT